MDTDEVNQRLAESTGMDIAQVTNLRTEFEKVGRNPTAADIEIIAIEHGADEQKVKELYNLHAQERRKSDGFNVMSKRFDQAIEN